jgi:hypothetical protein
MSASTSSGHNDANAYRRLVPTPDLSRCRPYVPSH